MNQRFYNTHPGPEPGAELTNHSTEKKPKKKIGIKRETQHGSLPEEKTTMIIIKSKHTARRGDRRAGGKTLDQK